MVQATDKKVNEKILKKDEKKHANEAKENITKNKWEIRQELLFIIIIFVNRQIKRMENTRKWECSRSLWCLRYSCLCKIT